MSGITIGVFSVIGVMTTVSAMRGSIETGLSFLGSNMFQIKQFPTGITGAGPTGRKIEARKNVHALAQAQLLPAVDEKRDRRCVPQSLLPRRGRAGQPMAIGRPSPA